MRMSGSLNGVAIRCIALISRVSVRKDDAILYIHVKVAVSDFQSIEELAEVDMGDSSVPIGV
jgi:hypothetical protein